MHVFFTFISTYLHINLVLVEQGIQINHLNVTLIWYEIYFGILNHYFGTKSALKIQTSKNVWLALNYALFKPHRSCNFDFSFAVVINTCYQVHAFQTSNIKLSILINCHSSQHLPYTFLLIRWKRRPSYRYRASTFLW